ncbi:MAG: hypothetical protein FWE61_10230 [Micrococcales bacterium]|nr:hypothetical protein [Micrococcales bacterium]
MSLVRQLLVPVLVGAVVLGGCSHGAPDDPDLPVGPISGRLDAQYRGNLTAQVTAAIETDVATCMADAGFGYTPTTQTYDADLPAWGSPQFATTYGYAITTWRDMPHPAVPGTAVLDEAYRQALWGPDVGEAGPEATWQPAGCYGQVLAAMDLAGSTVVRDVNDLAAQASTDDRVVAAVAGWATCMAGKGYPYATPDDARTAIVAKTYSADGTPLAGAALDALRAEEIATAVADNLCATDLVWARASVLAELETTYYAAHKADVDALFTRLEELLDR